MRTLSASPIKSSGAENGLLKTKRQRSVQFRGLQGRLRLWPRRDEQRIHTSSALARSEVGIVKLIPFATVVVAARRDDSPVWGRTDSHLGLQLEPRGYSSRNTRSAAD